MKTNSYYNQKGVTLIEALVAMTVFGLALGLLAGIMSNSLRQQRQLNAQQLLAGNARDVIETIAREVRLDAIDYEQHLITSGDDLTDPIDHLYLKNSAGETLWLTRTDYASNNDVTLNNVPINSSNIDVLGLNFYIQPVTDPFFIHSCAADSDCVNLPIVSPTCLPSGICKLVNDQPRVTIVLHAQLRGITDPTRQSTINLQTTVTTRRYQR
jgi:prepilin-type N-terminal cleavage/methylation domain-containing protein